MSATGTSRERGFTLLELLIVVALIGLLSLVGAQSGFRSQSELDTLADRVERTLSATRQTAREQGASVSIRCNMLGGPSSPTSRDGGDPSPAIHCRSDGRPVDVLTFYPDGSTSGGTVEIGAGAQQAHIAIHWLTGAVTRD